MSKLLFLFALIVFSIVSFLAQKPISNDEFNNNSHPSKYSSVINHSLNYGMSTKGRLGDTLMDGGYLIVEPKDYVKYNTTADYVEIKTPLSTKHFTLSFIATSEIRQALKVIVTGKASKWSIEERMDISTGSHRYRVNILAPNNDIENIRIFVGKDYSAKLSSVYLNHHYFKDQINLLDPNYSNFFINDEKLTPTSPLTVVSLAGETPELNVTIKKYPDFKLKNMAFKKKRFNTDYQFTIRKQKTFKSVDEKLPIPTIFIDTDKDNLYGKNGILDNKELKGRESEKPADFFISTTNNKQKSVPVGLRFHGGGPGRKRELESFRIYFRNVEFESKWIFKGSVDSSLKSLVLKYTLQANHFAIKDTNPFSHALALNVAKNVKAIAPRSQLVKLQVNGEDKGLYLAMDHFSYRTITRWLNDENISMYTYKKGNTYDEKFWQFYFIGNLIKVKGEDSLIEAKKLFNIDNIINSALLTAYIGDDDYCQGVDLLKRYSKDKAEFSIFNWDLDHGFVDFDYDKTRELWKLPAFKIFTSSNTICPRQGLMENLFKESSTFRDLFEARLNSALDNELSYQSLRKVLNEYQEISNYYDGKYDEAIKTLDNFIQNRPNFLLEQFNKLQY